MASTLSRKRKRPITSCGECYRRKQKCDRELPCAICVARGIPERCSFGIAADQPEYFSLQEPKRIHTILLDNQNSNANVTEDILVPPAELDEQTGYSTSISSNYGILQKTLHREANGKNGAHSRSESSVPDFVLLQLVEIERQLPTYEDRTSLITLYFDQCWWWFSSLEPTAFRLQFKQWHEWKSGTYKSNNAKEQRYFSALLFQVLAVAVQYLTPKVIELWRRLNLSDAKSADLLSARYSKAGMQIMDLLGRHDSTISAVQHDMMRGIWVKNISRGTEAWYCLGNAIRQAQELGLHLDHEPPHSLTNKMLNEWLWQDLLRKRVWACLFCWDAHVAFTLGRPRIINAKDCAKINLLPWDYPDTPALRPPSQQPTDSSRPWLITPVIFHYSLAYLIHDMLDVGADKPNLKDYSFLEKLHTSVDELLEGLPGYWKYASPDTSWDQRYPRLPDMRLHIASMAFTYLVALHRAHVLRRPASCEAAVKAATSTLNAQEKLFTITDQQRWRIYTYAFYTIDSSIFLAALMLEQPDTLDREWQNDMLDALHKSLIRLQKMQEVSPMARTGAQILSKCYERVQNRDIAPSPLHAGTTEIRDQDPKTPAMSHSTPRDEASLKSWIEQMDQVMLPILEADSNGPFDDSLWQILLEG